MDIYDIYTIYTNLEIQTNILFFLVGGRLVDYLGDFGDGNDILNSGVQDWGKHVKIWPLRPLHAIMLHFKTTRSVSCLL